MKKLLPILTFLTAFGCGSPSESNQKDTTPPTPVYFSSSEQALTIAEVPIATRNDTLSYALGVAWAHGIGRTGMYRVSAAFYLGASDVMNNRTTWITPAAASHLLEQRKAELQGDSRIRPSQRLSEIGLHTPQDSLSYALGALWCKGAKEYGLSQLTPALLLGLSGALHGDTTLLTYRKADQLLRGHVEAQRRQQYADLIAANAQWLLENKRQPGIDTLPDGVQYRVLRTGNGRKASLQSAITCHYEGRLTDGSVIESSVTRGQPLKLFPTGYLPGWTQALLHMPKGSRWELYIPAHLAFGSGGLTDKVPPFATVIYEIEVLDVE